MGVMGEMREMRVMREMREEGEGVEGVARTMRGSPSCRMPASYWRGVLEYLRMTGGWPMGG